MKEFHFIESRRLDWAAWDHWLSRAAVSALADDAEAMTAAELPARFRRLCQDLALAQDRRYSESLVNELRERTLLAYQRLYGARRSRLGWLDFLLRELPVLVRAERRVVLAAALLFFGPFFLSLIAIQMFPDLAHLLMSEESISDMREMYSPTNGHLGRPRAADDEVMMLGYYIANNVKIDFQCFAGGLAFTLGSIFFLIFNGLFIGAVAGDMTQIGYIPTFWGFVSGHSGPELLGIVLSGASGLKLGAALVAPGRSSRAAALRRVAPVAARLLYGAAVLTFSAAFVEAFWSPRPDVAVPVKYAVGIGVWIVLVGFLCLAGRGRHAA